MKKHTHCTICGEKDPTKFYSGRKNRCKTCTSAEKKISYQNLTNKTEYIKKQKEWRLRNFIHSQILQAKHRSIKHNREFELTDDIIIKKLEDQNHKCYISKLPIILEPESPYSLSIDRIDSNKGYTIDNTIIVTKFVNNCKNNLSLNDFIKYIKEVCNNL